MHQAIEYANKQSNLLLCVHETEHKRIEHSRNEHAQKSNVPYNVYIRDLGQVEVSCSRQTGDSECAQLFENSCNGHSLPCER